jgi:uncharacterized protein (DUF1499 family)
MTKRTMIVLLLVAVCILLIGVRWVNSRSQPLHTLGVSNGRLAECPDSTNCVSTQAADPEHHMDPIPFTQSAEEAQQQLKAVIRSMPRSRIVNSISGYIHAEFSSPLFGFVDDLEVAIDETEQLIHFRSASRTGLSDLGVNRKRMDQIRQQFQNR